MPSAAGGARTPVSKIGTRGRRLGEYLHVDPHIVRSIVERDLDGLLGFVRAIRDRME
ncbi:MAG: hypothetical protein KDC98_05875 [Planctomycetes bacterium]|nr:hypothetical protein [Planctomycetota bacterium]